MPPRPQLSYTVQQQREIVEALIADRENARYTSQVVRYRSGLSTLPPPPAPPVSEVTEAPEQAAPAGGAPSTKPDAATPKESLLRAETFDVFLRALSRKFGSDAPKPAAPPEAPTTSVEPKQDTSQDAAAPDVVPTAGSVNDSADEIAPQAPSPRSGTAVAAPQAARSDQLVVSAPLPPTETAVTARQATGVDETTVQAPLPPTQTAVAARQATDPNDPEASTRIPAPRPERAARAGPMPASMPEPPPGKPAWPVDGRSAAGAAPPAGASTAAFTFQPTHIGARLLSIDGNAVL